MRLLAEEVGLVGADGIDQVDHLLDVVAIPLKEVVAILLVRRQVESGDSPLLPAFEHDLFVRAQGNARLLVDQAAEPVQIAARKAVGVSGHKRVAAPQTRTSPTCAWLSPFFAPRKS